MTKQVVNEVAAQDGDEGLLQEYALAEVKFEEAKSAFKEVKERVMARFDTDIVGDHELRAGKWVANVKVGEKVKWDSEEIAAYYGSSMPLHVKRVLSITETDWKRLDSETRIALNKAREVSAGTASLSVEVAR